MRCPWDRTGLPSVSAGCKCPWSPNQCFSAATFASASRTICISTRESRQPTHNWWNVLGRSSSCWVHASSPRPKLANVSASPRTERREAAPSGSAERLQDPLARLRRSGVGPEAVGEPVRLRQHRRQLLEGSEILALGCVYHLLDAMIAGNDRGIDLPHGRCARLRFPGFLRQTSPPAAGPCVVIRRRREERTRLLILRLGGRAQRAERQGEIR